MPQVFRLSPGQEEALRQDHVRGVTWKELQSRYRVSRGTVATILKRGPRRDTQVGVPRPARSCRPKLPEPTGELIVCGSCGKTVRRPCIACWAKQHPGQRNSELADESDLNLDLWPEAEARRLEVRCPSSEI